MEQHYMEILLEEMRSKFDLVLEGHAVLNTRIDALDRKIDENHDLTTFKLEVMTGQIAEMSGRIGGLENRVGNLEVKADAIAADLAAHRADTEAHPRYLVRE